MWSTDTHACTCTHTHTIYIYIYSSSSAVLLMTFLPKASRHKNSLRLILKVKIGKRNFLFDIMRTDLVLAIQRNSYYIYKWIKVRDNNNLAFCSPQRRKGRRPILDYEMESCGHSLKASSRITLKFEESQEDSLPSSSCDHGDDGH